VIEEKDKMIKDTWAKITGVNPEEVIFNDSRKRKKRTKKSETNLKLTGKFGTQYIDYKDIEKIKNRKIYKIKENLEEWTSFDFVMYAHELYFDKFKKDWNLRIPAASIEITKIHDAICDIFGFCSKTMLKDCIKFFFKNHIDIFIKQRKDFYFNQLRDKNVLESFYYNYRKKDKVKKDIQILSNELIEKTYILNEENIIYEYGIVIAINWLIMYKKIDKKTSISKILNVCYKAYKNNTFGKIIDITEKYSPYPEWFIFKKIDNFIDKVNKEIKINVAFNNISNISDKFLFIKENK
jgi:hypothetical protein